MASNAASAAEGQLPPVDLKPLLAKMWPNDDRVTPAEVAHAISHFFTNQVTEAQTASLLMALHFTQMDFRADVLAECASAMTKACAQVPIEELRGVIEKRNLGEGKYNGGLVSRRERKKENTLLNHIGIHFSPLPPFFFSL